MGIFDQNNNSSSGGFSGRFISALLIVVLGLFMYFCQEQENPVTGEQQHVSISPSEEIKLGLQSAPAMSQKMGGELSASDPRAQEVKKMGAFLVTHTVASHSPWKFQFHLLADTKMINAFALPGGQVFITLGLLNALQTEAQLAGVLSHEMGHVIERHSAQQIAKGQLGALLVSAVTVASTDPQNREGAYAPAVIASVVNQMAQLRYSRKDESQADEWGLKLMTESGYDPRAMIEVMKILKSSGGKESSPEIFQTHPNPDLRIKQIEAYLEQHPPAQGLREGRKLKEVFGS